MSLEIERRRYEDMLTSGHYLEDGPAYQEGHLLDMLAEIVAQGGSEDEMDLVCSLTSDALKHELESRIEEIRRKASDPDRLEAARLAAHGLAGSGLAWNSARLILARAIEGKE